MRVRRTIFKAIIVSVDDIDKFEQKEMKKIRPIKNTWYDSLVSYFPEPIRKSVDGFKDKTVSLFKTNIHKQTVHGRRKKLNKRKTLNKIRNFFILENKEKETKDRMFTEIWTEMRQQLEGRKLIRDQLKIE